MFTNILSGIDSIRQLDVISYFACIFLKLSAKIMVTLIMKTYRLGCLSYGI